MVPSSPNGPCKTGKMTSNGGKAAPVAPGTSSRPELSGITCSAAPSPPRSSRASGSPFSSQRPLWVMPRGATSYLSRSSAAMIERAEASDTWCSPERPPKITPTRSLRFMCKLSLVTHVAGYVCRHVIAFLRIQSAVGRVVRPVAQEKDLGDQFHPELLVNSLTHQVDERQDIGGAGRAGVDDEVGVARRDLCPTDLVSLETGGFDQAARVVAGRVAKDAAGAGLNRLGGAPPGQVRLRPRPDSARHA